MELIELPLTSYLLILFGLLVLTIIVRSLRMPPKHYENQQLRSLARKKILLKNNEELDGKDDNKNQGN